MFWSHLWVDDLCGRWPCYRDLALRSMALRIFGRFSSRKIPFYPVFLDPWARTFWLDVQVRNAGYVSSLLTSLTRSLMYNVFVTGRGQKWWLGRGQWFFDIHTYANFYRFGVGLEWIFWNVLVVWNENAVSVEVFITIIYSVA